MRRRSARCDSSLMFSLETREQLQPCDVQERDCTNGPLFVTTQVPSVEELNDNGLFEQRKLTAFQMQRLNTFCRSFIRGFPDEGK